MARRTPRGLRRGNGMTFLAPMYLVIAGVAVAALIGLHVITRHRPALTPLPTARFVPQSAANITARAFRLSDRSLLALRTLALVAAALAMAGPILDRSREPNVRIVIVDASRAVADSAEVRDSALAYLRPSDQLVLFDSTPRVIRGEPRDSLAVLSTRAARGSLSAALITAFRAAVEMRDRADSVELVLVSPLVHEHLDAATPELRGLHPGRVRLVRVTAAMPSRLRWPVELRSDPEDPLAAALRLGAGVFGVTAEDGTSDAQLHSVRIVRDTLTAADSQWVRTAHNVLVFWPENVHVLPSARQRVDTIGAVVAGRAAVLSSFERIADPASGDRVVARWADGAAAATERRWEAGGGCIREVAVPVPVVGDLVLRPGYAAFLNELIAPCGGHARLQPVDDSTVALMRGDGTLFPTDQHARPQTRSPLAPWLLALALAAALVELPVRRRRAA